MLTMLQFASQFHTHDGAAMGIAVQLAKSSQLLGLLNIQKMNGLVHKFGREESGGGIARRTVNMPFPDTERGVVVPDEERFEIAGAKVKTDHRMVKVTEQARGLEIARRTRTLARYIDKQLLHGDGLNDATQIKGLRDRVKAEQIREAGANGAQLTLAMFEDLIDRVDDQGAGRFVIAPKKLCRKLKQLIVASAGGASVAEATGEIMVYEGVKVYPAEKDEAGADLFQFNESHGNSDVTASMYCIAPGSGDDEGVNVLMASNSIELVEEGIRDSFYHDQIEVAFGVCVFHHKAIARLKGVLKPT